MKVRKRGISEVVAALILLAITIGAFAFLVSGYFLKTQNTVQNIVLLYKQGQIKTGQFLSVIFHSETFDNPVNPTLVSINVTLMNYGLYPIQIQDIYVDGKCVYPVPGSVNTCPVYSGPPTNQNVATSFCAYDNTGNCATISCSGPIFIGLSKNIANVGSLCSTKSQSWPQVITVKLKNIPCGLIISGCGSQMSYEFFLYSAANQAYVWQL
jgi:flagellin-like protein